VCATGEFARRSFEPLSATLPKRRCWVSRPSTNVEDSEAQSLDQDLDVLAEEDGNLTLDLPEIPTSDLEAPSIKWLLETSTDPEVVLAAVSLVPQVQWPLDFDVSDMLHQLSDIFTSCVSFDGKIVPSLEEKASACAMALSHLYYGCVHAHPDRINFFGVKRHDEDVLYDVWRRDIANHTVVAMALNLCSSGSSSYIIPDTNSVPALEQLLHVLHVLPYHFVAGRADKGVENLAIAVMSKLLYSPVSPSSQIIANCTLLVCVMIGVQFDKKDIIRVDKRCY